MRIKELERVGDAELATVSLSSCDVGLQEGRQLDFKSKVLTDHESINTNSLTDTGASAKSFMNANFAKHHKIPLIPLMKAYKLRLADGTMGGNITHVARVIHALDDHVEELYCLITPLARFDVILGMPWLELHDPHIQFGSRTCTFNSDHCITNCLQHQKPVTIQSGAKIKRTTTPIKHKDIAEISAYAFMRMSEKDENQTIAMWPEDFERLEQGCEQHNCGSGFTADVAAISPEDYEKFFQKMRKTPLTVEQLKRKVPSVYHKWIEVWNPVEANKLPPHRSIDHSIKLQEGAIPPAKRAYGMSREQALVVKEYVEEMLGKGYIRPSTSPYAAPVLIVKKPDGGLRICIDYRALNALTIKNRNAPPLIRETLSKLCAAKIYSKFDIIAAFNEIRMKEGDEEKTAFLTRYGLFEYVVMPFGLCNAPSTFQAFINEVLREHLDVFCSAYLDDILVYSNTKEEHIGHVGKVLEKLSKAGLYLDINKCQFHVQEVKYLGLIITTEGLKMDSKKIETIVHWKTPRCVKDVQAFLGFANFYRRFIHGYSKIAAPLTNLTRKEQKSFIFPWAMDGAEQHAFADLKRAFTSAPILAHFDPEKETWLETDASDYVVAAILSQRGEDGHLHPVAFLSKKMSPQECNYEIYDKELLAIIRAFEEWHPELAGTPVEDPIRILTDHKNLEYFMTSKQLNRRQARWAEFLSEFNFKISYRPGKQGTKPDSLTRRVGDLPVDANDDRHAYQNQVMLKQKHLSKGMTEAVQLASMLLDEREASISEIVSMIYDLSETGVGDEESAEESSSTTSGHVEEPSEESTVSVTEDIISQVQKAYGEDNTIQRLLNAKISGQQRIPPDLVKEGIKIELGDCEVHDNMLYIGPRLYVPDDSRLRTQIIKDIHESPPGGHAGRSSTYDRVSTHYYWPRMTDSVARYVKSCHACKRSKSYKEGKQGLLKPLPIPDRYWQDISIDFITPLPKCSRYGRVYQHIMVVVDRLSKKKKFIPLDSLEVEAVVQAFVEWIWREEGYPTTIISDRGTQFTALFWQRLCQRIGTKPKLSTAFHPETDGQTESANAALKQFLRSYVNYNQDNWVDFLSIAEFEANSDKNSSSGIAPFLATKGYIPRSGLEPPTPWDKDASQRAKREVKAADDFIKKMDDLRHFLQEELKWSQALMTEQANRHRRPAPEFKEGDMVMLDSRNIKTSRPSKSLDHKNLGPYKIIRVINNMAYELELPDGMNIFPVFHPWLLHTDNSDPLPGQTEPPPPAVHTDEEGTEHYVDEVIDSQIDGRRNDPVTGTRGCLMYKFKWTGYSDPPKWEPYTNAAGCPDLVADFHHSRPDKPGPHKSFRTPGDWEPLIAMLMNSSRVPVYQDGIMYDKLSHSQ